MDINAIMQAISAVGFPIVVAIMAIWIIYKQNEQHRQQIDHMTANHYNEIIMLSDKHAKEIEVMTESLNANTLAITKLTALIGGAAGE